MPIKVKVAGAYATPAAVLVKKSGVYSAVLGAFVKVAGAYQAVYTSSTAPTVISAPSITGTPTYGTPTAATAAVFAGTPTPTITYQWNIDGVPIGSPVANGSQQATFPNMLSSHIGKTLTRTDTATNAGGATSSTSPGVVVATAWLKQAVVKNIFTANINAYAYESRVAMADSGRPSLIYRNPNADPISMAAAAQTNDQRDMPGTGYFDVPGNSESELTNNTTQVWTRAKPLHTTTSITNASGTTAIVTKVAHGLADGKIITMEGASPAGFNISGSVGTAITLLTADTYSYQLATAIGSPATVQGLVKPFYPYPIEIDFKVAQP